MLLAKILLRDIVESVLGSVYRTFWELDGGGWLVFGLLLKLGLGLRLELRKLMLLVLLQKVLELFLFFWR